MARRENKALDLVVENVMKEKWIQAVVVLVSNMEVELGCDAYYRVLWRNWRNLY